MSDSARGTFECSILKVRNSAGLFLVVTCVFKGGKEIRMVKKEQTGNLIHLEYSEAINFYAPRLPFYHLA